MSGKKKTKQNRSHAVMSQRVEPGDSLDFFPTPPWGTRALIEHVPCFHNVSTKTALDPGCGGGAMAMPLREYFDEVYASDIVDRGYGEVVDFLGDHYKPKSVDWVIMNPPFNLAEQFVVRALDVAEEGVAVLARLNFLEGTGRYKRLYSVTPPTYVAQFAERLPMFKGRLEKKKSTATAYAWFVWKFHSTERKTRVIWIPPCRKSLERPEDYV